MGSWREGLCLSQSSRCPDRVTRKILPTPRSEVWPGWASVCAPLSY